MVCLHALAVMRKWILLLVAQAVVTVDALLANLCRLYCSCVSLPLLQSVIAVTVYYLTATIAMPFTAGWPLCGEGPA